MKVNLSNVLTELNRQLSTYQTLTTKISKLRLKRYEIEIIAELAFLKVFTEWEFFLEESFIRYLVGGLTPSGYCPKRYVNPPNMEIAKKILNGDNKAYINWNSAASVVNRAKIFFDDGEPYRSAIQTAMVNLDEMNVIRNRIAHKSKHSKDKFSEFTRRKFGYGVRGMTPGKFLLATSTDNPGITFLEGYIIVIQVASQSIIR